MNKDLSKISRLLAQGFSYPGSTNCDDTFFAAVKEIAKSFGIPCSESAPDMEELRSAYTLLFINEPHGRWAPPFSSVYLGSQGLLMDKGREQAMKFYQEAGVEPADSAEPEDFLPTELHFVAELIEAGDRELLQKFLNEHLLKWFPAFERRVKALNPHPYYLLMTELTSKFLNTIHQEVIDETT